MDWLPILFQLDIQTLCRMRQTNKSHDRQIGTTSSLWQAILRRDFGKEYPASRSLSDLQDEVRLKFIIKKRCLQTLTALDQIARQHQIDYQLAGGMALNLHFGLTNRFTRDIDIDNITSNSDLKEVRDSVDSDTKSEPPEWWQSTLSFFLEKAGWIHVRDPFQHEDLYANYANSYAHPDFKIVVDIDLDQITPSPLLSSIEQVLPAQNCHSSFENNSIRFAQRKMSLVNMIWMKLMSSERRRRNEGMKDITDVASLIKLYQLGPDFISHCPPLAEFQEKWETAQSIAQSLEPFPNNCSKVVPFLMACALDDEVIIEDCLRFENVEEYETKGYLQLYKQSGKALKVFDKLRPGAKDKISDLSKFK